MALSEKEQELLAQMEAALTAEDPKLANTLRGKAPDVVHRRRAALAVIGFVAGVGVLLLGMMIANWVVSVVGFLLMLVSTVSALTSWSRATTPNTPRSSDAQDFLHRLEEQWRKNNEGS